MAFAEGSRHRNSEYPRSQIHTVRCQAHPSARLYAFGILDQEIRDQNGRIVEGWPVWLRVEQDKPQARRGSTTRPFERQNWQPRTIFAATLMRESPNIGI